VVLGTGLCSGCTFALIGLYSGLVFAARNTFSHLQFSPAMSLPKAAGEAANVVSRQPAPSFWDQQGPH
jgi:hypothetical protein